MISHTYKTVFIHIPKAAGQSIERYFLNLEGLSWEHRAPLLLRANDDPTKGPPKLAHLSAKQYVDLGYLSEQAFSTYFTFSIVRNPWSRAVSMYKYFRFDRVLTFELFLEKKLPKLMKEMEWFVGPQANYLYDGDRCLIDFIGKLEYLERDFSFVCERLEIPFTGLPHTNKSGKRKDLRGEMKRNLKFFSKYPEHIFIRKRDQIQSSNYIDYYDERSVERIRSIYAEDIERFNYTFE